MAYNYILDIETKLQALRRENKALREAAQDKLDTETDCWAANSDSVLYAAQARNVKAHDALAALLLDG